MDLKKISVGTPWGVVELCEAHGLRSDLRTFVIYRHGFPHNTLPHLINYRGYAAALKLLNCTELLITSSVGVLDEKVPLNTPLLLGDLLMPDMRLPTGDLCTMFSSPSMTQEYSASTSDDSIVSSDVLEAEARLTHALRPAHLVWQGPHSTSALDQQLIEIAAQHSITALPAVRFAYVPGPRTKTPAENAFWYQAGAQVNSMSVGPELVLANELEISTSTLLVGHKRSRVSTQAPHPSPLHDKKQPTDTSLVAKENTQQLLTQTLDRSHAILEKLVITFLKSAVPTTFPHHLYRFNQRE